jgi:hypothetical protein
MECSVIVEEIAKHHHIKNRFAAVAWEGVLVNGR